MISMEMIKSFSYLHRTLIACLFLRVTHTKIRRIRKMAVRMEDSGSYLKIMMITMIVALVMAMAMKMVTVMMVVTLVMMMIMRIVILMIGGD